MDEQDDSIIDLNKLTGQEPQDDGFKIGRLENDSNESFEGGATFNEDIVGKVEKISEYEFKDLDSAIEEFAPMKEKFGKSAGIEAVGDQDGVTDRVKIKFDKFVTLVATHTYEDILRKNADQDVIISTNLLTDLANAHEDDTGSKKVPILFAAGIVLGIVIAWLIFR